MFRKLPMLWRENRVFLIFLLLMFVFRSAFADWNEVPTGSMKPTIIEGDRLLVNKMAYDLRLPFTHISLIKRSDPERGDIVIFDSQSADKRLVKRVIGLPGDVVAMRNNRLRINGQDLAYRDATLGQPFAEAEEDLLGLRHKIWFYPQATQMSSFEPVRIPEGHYMVMGDSRDNSADSRVIGMVPRGEIVGRAKQVVMSLNYENYYIPRKNRFFHTL
ncbi:MAG: signal peptidase I [Pseudomonadales bacterium]